VQLTANGLLSFHYGGEQAAPVKGFQQCLGGGSRILCLCGFDGKDAGSKNRGNNCAQRNADADCSVQIVFDKDVIQEKWYGCSDGTTTGYMKIETEYITHKFLPFTKHIPTIIEV
jgi:Ala-tRNA(Pro) deacylase